MARSSSVAWAKAATDIESTHESNGRGMAANPPAVSERNESEVLRHKISGASLGAAYDSLLLPKTVEVLAAGSTPFNGAFSGQLPCKLYPPNGRDRLSPH